MAINSVDMDRALTSASYAQQVLRSGAATVEEKGQIAAKWGSDFVAKYSSVDTNDVKIDDVSYDAAKKAGSDNAANNIGYDGDKNLSSIGNAGFSVAGAAATGTSVAFSIGADLGAFGVVTGKAAEETAKKAGTKISGKIAKISAYVAAGIAIATATKYWAMKPNKEQVDATQKLLKDELPAANNDLMTTQEDMALATEELTELSEEAEEQNEETGEKIEEDKILFDFYKEQYMALKAKAESGAQLTMDEKSLVNQLAPLMEELGAGIVQADEDNSKVIDDIHDDMGDYQDVFDTSAEAIANVEGITDLAEGFDETTRTMCYIEGGSQALNSASGAWAGAKLLAGGFWNWALGIASIAAGASSGIASAEQFDYASKVTNEIKARREVQDIGTQTFDLYEEELENFEGNLEAVEDLTVEMPDDLAVPPAPTIPAGDDGQTGNTLGVPANNNGSGTTGNTGNTSGVSGTTGNDNDDKKDKDLK